MSTGTDLIERGLKAIGVFSVAVPSSPEQITDGLKRLNSMVQVWQSQGIKMGIVPLEHPGEELSEPIDATDAIVDNLAIRMAPDYSKPVSKDLRDNARRGYNDICTEYQEFTIPDKVVSSTLPYGEGNVGFRRRVFFPKGGTLNG